MPTFGDKNTFAINCVATGEVTPNNWVFIRCHLILGGEYIGDPEEIDVLGVIAGHLKELRKRLSEPGSLKHSLYDSLSEKEILELIIKSNQLEEEFDPAYAYLPALEHERLFGKHFFSVGESTDRYYLTIVEQSERLKFIWKNWDVEPDRVHSVTCDHEQVVNTINECLAFLKNTYPGRPEWLNLNL